MKIPALLLATAITFGLAACNAPTSVGTDHGSITSGFDGELNIRSEGLPQARITATGELFIDDKAVALDTSQRQLVTAYYGELNGITQAGIAVGKQGAELAGKAVGAAISGVLSGDTDSIDAKVNAEAKKIEAEAARICTHLTGLKVAQDALAAQVVEFKPYANLKQDDIDDCGKD